MDAEARTDERAKRHDRAGAGVLQLARIDRVVAAIDHDLKPFSYQDLRGLQGFFHVRIKRLLVGEHFQLHQRPAAGLARQAQRPQRIVSSEAAGGVWQIDNLARIDKIDKAGLAGIRKVHPAHRHGNHLCAAGF